MDKLPNKAKGGVKNKLGIKNVSHFKNIGGSSEWFILNKITYHNRYLKSFDNFKEAYDARNKTYAMFGMVPPPDDWDKFNNNKNNFLKKIEMNY
tara:strand:+ start:176 stop:457 length:282 start_codon:yes stop_codon:yes gene_type:complete